jgi:hypothetical protein
VTTSFTQTDEHIEKLKNAAAELLSAKVQALEPVSGGRNSRVYRLSVEPGHSFALKAYFRDPSDHRRRMSTEFASLSFLWQNDVRNIPKPLFDSPEHGCAIFEWIEGRRIGPQDITSKSIDSSSRFLSRLAELRGRPGSETLGPASEACFSGRAIVENLNYRLQPLMARTDDSDLRTFLAGELVPAVERISNWSRRSLGDRFDVELSLEERTLSPSDFGFHNALQVESGELCFLDFEYFGWDDTAKTISDFILHPGMTLAPLFRHRFVTSVIYDLPGRSGLAERVKAFYPLFGLKWCLILLNEFLPEQLMRRHFAGMSEQDRGQKQAEQLAKARHMLEGTLKEYEHFPYLD